MPAEGYLYKRGEVYWGRVRIAGREHRSSLRCSDLREAKKRLKAWKLKIEREVVGASDAPTWQEAVLKWDREVLPASVKPMVQRRYMTSVTSLTTTLRGLRVDQITPSKISEYVSSRAGRVSNATIRRDLTALSRLLAACQAWGWIETNPARNYDRSAVLRERRDPITPPTTEDFAAVLAVASPPMARVLNLLAQTGMRQMEAVLLTASDIDRDRQTITLTRTKTSRPRTLQWVTPGGDASEALGGLPENGALFPSRDGVAYKNFASFFGKVIRRVEADAKAQELPFRRFRVHDLRHWFAIRWLRAGGDIYSLSKHLGHTSVRTTEVYLGFLAVDGFTQTRAQ